MECFLSNGLHDHTDLDLIVQEIVERVEEQKYHMNKFESKQLKRSIGQHRLMNIILTTISISIYCPKI